MDIKQLQDDLAVTIRVTRRGFGKFARSSDLILGQAHELSTVLKKDENINQLTNDLQECMKELGVVKAILPKVFQERDFMWEEVKSYSEMNMLLNYEINMLKRKEVALEGTSIHDIVHQNSTYGAAENVGTAAKPNGIMHEPVHQRLSSRTTFLLGLGVKVVLESKILSLHNQPSFLTFETERAAVENVFNLKGFRYFGHCISYAIVASMLLGAAISWYLLVTDPLVARRDALKSTVIRLREGFHRKDQNSSASSCKGCGSSVKRSSMLMLVILPEVGSSYVDRNLEHNSSLVVCSSSDLESQGGDSSTSTSANQHILDLNLALAFQEKLSDPRITSMLKWKERHTDRELANLLQDKGLDPNFAVMLKENGLDPMILALLQRSSLYADQEHRDSNPPVTDTNDVEDVLPNHISFSEELRLQGLGKWLQRCRVMLHHVAGTPERAWLLFSLIFILETVVVAIFRPQTIKLLNATHQ
ncbi:hypothetical protein FXO38_30167 [Capsicum annuum]|nr:hypothetical protein FXO38_30167 [Capsicum annuum]